MKMKEKHINPLVSIITPCYNGENYLERYLDSVLEQTYDNIELILVNDGSNDKTSEIANRYKKLKMVGSDAHIFFELGRNYNMMEDFNSEDTFLKNLENVIFKQKKCIKISHQITKIVKLVKLLLKGELSELFRIIRKKYKRRK